MAADAAQSPFSDESDGSQGVMCKICHCGISEASLITPCR